MPINPVIVITHAAFDEARHIAMQGLMSDLRIEAPGMPVILQDDWDRKGSLWCWREGMTRALEAPGKFTHVIWLPDDAIICKDFGRIITACIGVRPEDVFDCFVNHPLFRTHAISTCWYSTSDGYTGVGGVMPRELIEEHFAWREANPELGDYPNDAGVNLWAIWTERRIYKTAWSLVTHNDSLPSLDGHDKQVEDGIERVGMRPVGAERHGIMEDVMNFLGRTYLAPEEHMPGHARSCVDLGPTYKSNMFDMVRLMPPEAWNLDGMYKACHPPNEAEEHVVILVPVYRETEEILRQTRPSREAVAADLEANGVQVTTIEFPGDSHVDRMRQRATHMALKTGATRILWWDADIECLTPSCVRSMLQSGHNIIAGACPFKDGSGKVVCNPLPETVRFFLNGEGSFDLKGGCLEVRDAGTGFMLISRDAVLKLFDTHPDLCHLSRAESDRMEPLWAIWDASLVGAMSKSPMTWMEHLKTRTFETEDFFFCRLWQQDGGKVYVFVPARFRHWGTHGFEGSFEEQWGLQRAG